MGIDIRTFDSIEPGETVAVVEGDLDATTGRTVRNRLVKLMAGEPKSFDCCVRFATSVATCA
jgi:hypothetical protein